MKLSLFHHYSIPG